MADMRRRDAAVFAPYLDHLRDLSFVREAEVLAGTPEDRQADARLKIRTPRRTFTFALQLKQTFLDQALTNALIAGHATQRKQQWPLLLMARYIPRPTGERLAKAGVNFVDRLGNIHLRLGDDHHVLLLGRRRPATEATARRPGPALVQLYFVLLAEPAAAGWPVRRLADEAGIGKTAAASAVQRLVRLGVLAEDRDQRYRLADHRQLTDAFLQGYVNVLRPHLEIGRFRAAERDQRAFLQQFAETAGQMHATWAVSGAPAAYALDRFYRGEEASIFVDPFQAAMQRALRLVPDRAGPITLLRPFGSRWMWKMIGDLPVAHPWLIYSELLHLGEPRALEAADHIRERFLAA